MAMLRGPPGPPGMSGKDGRDGTNGMKGDRGDSGKLIKKKSLKQKTKSFDKQVNQDH